EMIAGAGPFDDVETDRGVAQAHIDRVPPRLGARAVVPEALDELVALADRASATRTESAGAV
ncbi:MAG TPA: hypothetical protein VIF62_38740, partial [Labilithrix sp.]